MNAYAASAASAAVVLKKELEIVPGKLDSATAVSQFASHDRNWILLLAYFHFSETSELLSYAGPFYPPEKLVAGRLLIRPCRPYGCPSSEAFAPAQVRPQVTTRPP